jgi:glycosyltransferase involved in cell wall biosynthesis
LQITGIIFGKDQGSHLRQAFESLAGVDYLLYGDGGSTDDSVEIAESFGARIVDVSGKCGGEARNFTSQFIPTEWAFWISPDDICDEGVVAKIKARLEEGYAPNGLNVNIREGDGHFVFPRVYRKDAKWIGRCHEYINTNLTAEMILAGVDVALYLHQTLDAWITHTRGPWHDKPTDPDGIAKALRADIEDDPENPRWRYYLGRELHARGMYEEAITVLEARLRMVTNLIPESHDAALILSKCYEMMGRRKDAQMCCLMILRENAHFKEAVMWMAKLAPPDQEACWLAMTYMSNNSGVMAVRC